MERDLNETAVRLLARREHSQAELQRKLIQKGFKLAAIEQALQDLIAQNLLSDERFTEVFISSRSDRGTGPVKIQAELQQRGVQSEIIHRYLDMRDPEWLALAEQVRVKKFGGERPSAYEQKIQQARFLANRGFSHEQIRRVVDAEFETG
jgi:regulatory protein